MIAKLVAEMFVRALRALAPDERAEVLDGAEEALITASVADPRQKEPLGWRLVAALQGVRSSRALVATGSEAGNDAPGKWEHVQDLVANSFGLLPLETRDAIFDLPEAILHRKQRERRTAARTVALVLLGAARALTHTPDDDIDQTNPV